MATGTANPFYVHPGGDYGPGLTGLANTVMKVGQLKHQRQKDQWERDAKEKALRKTEEIRKKALEAWQSNDPNAVNKFMVQYPVMGEAMRKTSAFFDKETEKDYYDHIQDIVINPTLENVEGRTNERLAMLQAKGLPPEKTKETATFLERFKQDPEGAIKSAEMDLAAYLEPAKWKNFQKAKFGGLMGKPLTGDDAMIARELGINPDVPPTQKNARRIIKRKTEIMLSRKTPAKNKEEKRRDDLRAQYNKQATIQKQALLGQDQFLHSDFNDQVVQDATKRMNIIAAEYEAAGGNPADLGLGDEPQEQAYPDGTVIENDAGVKMIMQNGEWVTQ